MWQSENPPPAGGKMMLPEPLQQAQLGLSLVLLPESISATWEVEVP